MTDILSIEACSDCLIAIANDDYTGMDLERETAVRTGIVRWGAEGFHLIPDGKDLGFRWSVCDVCLTPLGGDRHLIGAEDRSAR